MVKMLKFLRLLIFLTLAAALASGCNADFGDPPVLATRSGPDQEATSVEAVVQTLKAGLPVGAGTRAPEVTATSTPDIPEMTLCSPLPGYDLARLKGAISNPYSPPPLGSDDPHQGVDFADIQYGVAINGHDVQAVLPGTVTTVISNRFPYGNAIIIETPLNSLPGAMQEKLLETMQALPTPIPSALTCPNFGFPWDGQPAQSLYLVYAHMEKPPIQAPGSFVNCGDTLGTIGQTGNALAPHLHLEARVGPAAATFTSIAHYEPYISEVEMANYCEWRISGTFIPVDPFIVLENGHFASTAP